jgi:hypothetical protein
MYHLHTSCLDRLSAHDFTFIEQVLSKNQQQRGCLATLLQDPELLPKLLDLKSMFGAVLKSGSPVQISPELYFYVLVRRALLDVGIEEVELADYVAATLATRAAGHRVPSAKLDHVDLEFTYQVDFLSVMEGANDYERFFLEVECGNQFLVLTGLFPRFLEQRAIRRGAPGVSYYEGVVQSAFIAAGGHPMADEFALRTLYPRLAEKFPLMRRALNRLAEECLFLER